MNICFITNLPVWSLGVGKGAPSFYNTLNLYHKKGNKITLLTTEKDLSLPNLPNIEIRLIRKYSKVESSIFFGLFRLISKYLIWLMNQFMGYQALKAYAGDSDYIYAYETEFVLPASLYSRLKKLTFISRFQGTVLTDLVNNSSFFKKLKLMIQFFDQIIALKINSHLTIMTNDGTKGDQVLQLLRKQETNVLFLRNGVDLSIPGDENTFLDITKGLDEGCIVFSSVSRLQLWKRVDRSIEVFEAFNRVYPNSHYYIVGDGEQMISLKKLVKKKELTRNVTFLGSLEKPEVFNVLEVSKYFLSNYELSNLGNPLYEAVNFGCIVATLNNGSTGDLIIHNFTGILSEEDSYLENARKLIELEENSSTQNKIKYNASEMLEKNLLSWEQRMLKEYDEVRGLNN